MDLRLLKTFVAVARLRHFARAAEELNATQSGVSQQIARLEEQLGYRLLHRTHRTVELTAAGQTILQFASPILTAMERMIEAGRLVDRGLIGKLVIGLSTSVVYSDVTSRIAEYKKDNPHLVIELIVQTADRFEEMLRNGAVDLAISTLPLDKPGFHSARVASQPMGVALPASHRLATGTEVTLEELKGDRFIVVPRDKHVTAHDALIAAMHSIGGALDIAAFEVAFPNLLARVALGEGVGFIPMIFAQIAPTGVTIVPVDDPKLAQLDIFCLWTSEADRGELKRMVGALTGTSPPRT